MMIIIMIIMIMIMIIIVTNHFLEPHCWFVTRCETGVQSCQVLTSESRSLLPISHTSAIKLREKDFAHKHTTIQIPED